MQVLGMGAANLVKYRIVALVAESPAVTVAHIAIPEGCRNVTYL